MAVPEGGTEEQEQGQPTATATATAAVAPVVENAASGSVPSSRGAPRVSTASAAAHRSRSRVQNAARVPAWGPGPGQGS